MAGPVACEGRGRCGLGSGAGCSPPLVLASDTEPLSPLDCPGRQACLLFYGGDSGGVLGGAVATDTRP